MYKRQSFANASANQVDTNRLIIGVVNGNQAKAYPIRFIGYHHQVMDTIDGKPILVTYCTVCRSGRVFEPGIEGKLEKNTLQFRSGMTKAGFDILPGVHPIVPIICLLYTSMQKAG